MSLYLECQGSLHRNWLSVMSTLYFLLFFLLFEKGEGTLVLVFSSITFHLTWYSLIAVAAHPQVRRKLEDVSQKLDILYDKLRKQVLSPATLQGLHTILQHIWQYDYQSCMQV